MSLRLIEAYLPEGDTATVTKVIGEDTALSLWQEEPLEGQVLVRILLPVESTQAACAHYPGGRRTESSVRLGMRS